MAPSNGFTVKMHALRVKQTEDELFREIGDQFTSQGLYVRKMQNQPQLLKQYQLTGLDGDRGISYTAIVEREVSHQRAVRRAGVNRAGEVKLSGEPMPLPLRVAGGGCCPSARSAGPVRRRASRDGRSHAERGNEEERHHGGEVGKISSYSELSSWSL